jgi:Ca2+-transporting ATPase
MVFSGTAATYGHGKAVVIATGMQTEMGRIAGLLKDIPDESTPLQRELDRTGKILGAVVIAIAAVMIVTIVLVEDVRSAAGLFDALILGIRPLMITGDNPARRQSLPATSASPATIPL